MVENLHLLRNTTIHGILLEPFHHFVRLRIAKMADMDRVLFVVAIHHRRSEHCSCCGGLADRYLAFHSSISCHLHITAAEQPKIRTCDHVKHWFDVSNL